MSARTLCNGLLMLQLSPVPLLLPLLLPPFAAVSTVVPLLLPAPELVILWYFRVLFTQDSWDKVREELVLVHLWLTWISTSMLISLDTCDHNPDNHTRMPQLTRFADSHAGLSTGIRVCILICVLPEQSSNSLTVLTINLIEDQTILGRSDG